MCDKQALEGWMSAFPLDAASGCTVPTGCCHLMIHFLFTYKVPLCSSRANISSAVISRFSLPGLKEPEVEAESKTRKLAGRAAFLLRFFTNNAFPDSSCACGCCAHTNRALLAQVLPLPPVPAVWVSQQCCATHAILLLVGWG